MKHIQRRIFTEEFKLEVIKLVTGQGLSITEVGRKLDIATKSLPPGWSSKSAVS